jgi:tetratricopeptide (TPR) repeat protein
MARRALALALALLFSMAASLAGDEIRLRGGGRLEGIVREERADAVSIETPAGLATVPLRDIESIDRSVRSVVQEYYERQAAAGTAAELLALAEWASENKLSRFVKGLQERAARLAHRDLEERAAALPSNPDAGSLYELGAWAQRHGLAREARELFDRAILRDPEHEAARRALGFKRFDGRWLTEEETMLAKGFSLFEGRWVTDPERALILEERAMRLKERERKLREDEERIRREGAKLDAREADVAARERQAAQREREVARDREALQAFERSVRALDRDLAERDRALTRLFGDPRVIVACSSCRIWWSRATHSSCPFCAYKK